jgi:hypothetical protein
MKTSFVNPRNGQVCEAKNEDFVLSAAHSGRLLRTMQYFTGFPPSKGKTKESKGKTFHDVFFAYLG